MEVAATSSLPSPSLWSSLNSWFTSTVFFILLNLMIATILFTSNLPQNNQPPQQQQEQEANNDDKDQQKETQKLKQPSILTRLKSFTFEHNHHDDDQDDVLDHHAQQPIEYVFNQPMHYQHFDFDQPTETIATHYDFNGKYSGEIVSGTDKFSGEFSGEVQDIETEDTLLDSEPTNEEILDHNGVEYEFESIDDVYSKLVDSKKSKMKKSTSLKVGFKDEYDDDMAAVEARRPETVRVKKKVMMVEEDEDDDDDVEVDSRADDFINKFKNDLKLQRIESIMKKGENKLK